MFKQAARFSQSIARSNPGTPRKKRGKNIAFEKILRRIQREEAAKVRTMKQ